MTVLHVVNSSGLAEPVLAANSDSFLSPQCQLIVCQMSSTRCQPLNWMLLPIALVLSVVVSGFAPNSETLLLYLLTAFLTLAHIHYGVVVVGELGTWALGSAAGSAGELLLKNRNISETAWGCKLCGAGRDHGKGGRLWKAAWV